MKTKGNYKNVIWLAVECLLLLAAVAGLFQKHESRELSLQNGEGELLTGPLALSAGVYEVRMEYSQTPGSGAVVRVSETAGRHKHLFADEIELTGQEGQKKFLFWLALPSENIAFQMMKGEGADLAVQSMALQKTRLGSCMALFLLFVFFLIFDGAFYFCYGKKRKDIGDHKERRMVFCALAGIVAAVSLPLLVDYCLEGSRLYVHLQRIEAVKNSLGAGRYPARIAGTHDGVFYGNVFLIVPALMRMIGFPVQDVWRILLFVINVATAWIAYGCFKRIFNSRVIGAVGSMLYTWAPYRIYDLYARAELGESMALCFLPIVCLGCWLLLSQDRTEKERRQSWIWLTVGFIGLLQTYFISFEVTAGFVALLCLICLGKTLRKAALAELGKTFCATLFVNMASFLPVLHHFRNENPFYAADPVMAHRGMYLAQYLLPFFRGTDSVQAYENGLLEAAPRGIGFAVTCLMFVYLWMEFTGRYRDRDVPGKQGRRLDIAVAAVGALALLMTTGSFPWDWIRTKHWSMDKLVSDMQTPACMVIIVLVCFVLVSCLTLWRIRQRESRQMALVVTALVVAAAFCTTQFLIGDLLREKPPLRIYNGEVLENVRAQNGQ